jgi:hypothetical protein
MSLFDSASLCITPNAYKEDKLYSIKPTDGSGDLVVTRATTATRVNSAGLIEECPYNLLTYSEQFDNAAWSKISVGSASVPVVTANSTTAPNGTLTADKIVFNAPASGDISIIKQNISLTGTANGSIYIKAFSNSDIGKIIGFRFNADTYALITLTDSWQRFSVSQVALESFDIQLRPSVGTSSGSVSVYVWGAQLVQGSSAKEYFPTTDRLNVPRIDYTNGTCPSILVEPQRTNLVFPSNIILSGNGTLAQNVAISPDGTNNANSFTPSGAGFIYTNSILTTLQTYTFSIYLKGTVNGQKVRIQADLNGDLIDFTLTNQWQKYSVTFNSLLGMQSFYILSGNYFSPAQNNLYYFYGAQLEAGSYATSLIPTQSTSVTRNADVISKTGISSLIGQTEGTIFTDFGVVRKQSGNSDLFVILNSSNSALGAYVLFMDNNGNLGLFSLPSSYFSILSGTDYSNNRLKIALAYNATTITIYVNGTQLLNTALTGAANMSALYLGANNSPANFMNGTLNSAQLYKTKLSNTELATLTTI